MIFFEKLQKSEKTTNRFWKNSAKRPKLYLTIPPKTKFYRDVYSFSSKSGWSKISKTKNLKTQKCMFIKRTKLVPKTEQQTNRFSKNSIKQTGLLPYNTPLKCTYPGTFIQIPKKVAGHFFEKSQKPKIQKSKNSKVRKSENPKIGKFENPKIRTCVRACVRT